MILRKTLETAHSLLTAKSIPHALIGGLALAVHGVHRATADVDFLIDGSLKNQALEALTAGGFITEFTSSEVAHLRGPGLVDLLFANRPATLQMLKDALESPELKVHVLRAEDIIGLKIQAYKNDPIRELQDKADIQALGRQIATLDLKRIQNYAELFGEWESVKDLLKP
jgi:trans-aconitate methyltransferase